MKIYAPSYIIPEVRREPKSRVGTFVSLLLYKEEEHNSNINIVALVNVFIMRDSGKGFVTL